MDQRISHAVMYIIAATLVICTAIVLIFKGPSAMPFGWIGVGFAAALAVGALAMTRLHFDQPH
jgi:hypothetical protein